jgi:hypothetical protein
MGQAAAAGSTSLASIKHSRHSTNPLVLAVCRAPPIATASKAHLQAVDLGPAHKAPSPLAAQHCLPRANPASAFSLSHSPPLQQNIRVF